MNDDELEELNRRLQRETEARNNAPHPDFEGLSPARMYNLIHFPLEENSWFGIRADLEDATVERMPIMRSIIAIMEAAEAGKGLKLTAKGNLPRKLLHEIFEREGWMVRSVFKDGRPMAEHEWGMIGTLPFIMRELGWCKKRNNYLSLTTKGRKILAGPRRVLFEEYLRFNLFRLHLGWNDLYSEIPSLQFCLAYALYLLYRHGRTMRKDEAYADAFFAAFPMIGGEIEVNSRFGESPQEVFRRVFTLRIFDRCLFGYGWIEYQGAHQFLVSDTLKATDLFYDVFEIREAGTVIDEAEHAEKEIESALFDAEMGGISHVSDETPLEIMRAFHDQIREFHAAEPQAPRPIVTFLPEGFPLVPPEEITEEKIAQREVERVLIALTKKNIVILPPEDLPAVDYYDFLYHNILPEEITLMGEGIPLYLPFEDFIGDAFSQDGPNEWTPETEVAETFLLSLFNLEETFPEDLLAAEVRLNNVLVSRTRAYAHLRAWRKQFQRIIPVFFGPGEVEEDGTGCRFPMFFVHYRVLTTAGEEKECEGPGVLQLIFDEAAQTFKVQGAQFPGFEF